MVSVWSEHAVWWHVYPLGFVGAPAQADAETPVVHRLRHLCAWLDYIKDLGVSGLALGPIFASSTHGYDTTDHFRIDPRLGDETDFDALIAGAHERGLRVMLDGVFNHVGENFPAFREALAEGPTATQANWFRFSWPANGLSDKPDYAVFEGHRQLVALNHGEPAVIDYVADVMDHWLCRGADAWRLDAAYAVPARFWAAVLPRVRARHPSAYVVGEVIHGDYAQVVQATGMDSVTQYELWKAIWSGLNDRNFFELAWALERHNGFLDRFVPLTFVGNHDVTRILSKLVDERHLPHALVILLMTGGTPSIYAGDEQGFRGVKEDRVGGDDAIRPVFPSVPVDLVPDGWPLFHLHKKLIELRRQRPWLSHAKTKAVHVTNRHLTLLVQHASERLLVALNLDDVGADQPAPGVVTVLSGEGEVTQPGHTECRVVLPAYGWAILQAS